MHDTRRDFLSLLTGAGTLTALTAFALDSHAQAKPQGGQQPPEPRPTVDDPDSVPMKSPAKAMLEANEKDIKKNIEKLYQLATDLKAEVEKTDSSQVLSLALVKKADEIEKLAHDIKNRAKG
jgi:hypothetical protein